MNYAGILLILLGVVFFILEIKISSFGLLSVAGVVSLTLGSIMLFNTPEAYQKLAWSVLIPTVAVASGFFILVATVAYRTFTRKSEAGRTGMLGEKGVAKTVLDPSGKVFVHGETWNASSDEFIDEGEGIEIVEAKGMTLKVKKR